jgi:hypothetical protein
MKFIEGLKLKNIAGERVIFPPKTPDGESSKIVVFNESAEWLWKQISEKEFTEEEAACLLVEYFGLDKAMAIHDVRHWVKQCTDAGIMT